MKGNFEISGQPKLLEGYMEADVYELGANGEPQNNTSIIRTDQDWGVVFKWGLRGPLSRMICGVWCLHVNLESIGPGPELNLPSEEGFHLHFKGCAGTEFTKVICVPKGIVSGKHCSVPYKLVATVTYLDECDRPGPMAGFVEGTIVQFYEAETN